MNNYEKLCKITGIKNKWQYWKEYVYIGSLAYLKALMSGLDANYRKMRFVQ